jgi:hypothetical protein
VNVAAAVDAAPIGVTVTDADALAEVHAPADLAHAADVTRTAHTHSDVAAAAATAETAAKAARIGRSRGCEGSDSKRGNGCQRQHGGTDLEHDYLLWGFAP